MPRRKKARKSKIPLEQDRISEIIRRIEECETVIGELDSSPLWGIVIKDLDAQRKTLDDNWQEINDPSKLQKARELKFATLHILNLRQKYQEELEAKKYELNTYQNTEVVIPKDYDMESNME